MTSPMTLSELKQLLPSTLGVVVILQLVVAVFFFSTSEKKKKRGWADDILSENPRATQRSTSADKPALNKSPRGLEAIEPSVRSLLEHVPALQGTLSKKSTTHRIAGWLDRWFEIHGAFIHYFKGSNKKQKGELLATINIYHISDVKALRDGEFELQLPDKVIRLRADSNSEAAEWVKNIKARKSALVDDHEADTAEADEDDELGRLLRQHATQIKSLRMACQDVLPDHGGEEWDDIWLLRYVLSFGSEGEPHVRKAIKWRKDNAELLKMAREDLMKVKGADVMRRYAPWVESQSRDGGLAIVLPTPPGGAKLLMDNATHDEVFAVSMAQREHMHIINDRLTREKRKIMKCTQVKDANGASMSDMYDSRFMQVAGKASKLAASVYPQMVKILIITNAPSFVEWLVKLASAFMSKGLMSKIRIGNAHLHEHMAPEDLPEFLGGSMVVAKAEPAAAPLDWVEVSVSARSEHWKSFEIEEAGVTVDWAVNVAAKGVNVAAMLRTPSGKVVHVLPETKIKADGGMRKGSFVCDRVGQLEFRFDNTYSVLRSKTLKYSITVRGRPEDQKPATEFHSDQSMAAA